MPAKKEPKEDKPESSDSLKLFESPSPMKDSDSDSESKAGSPSESPSESTTPGAPEATPPAAQLSTSPTGAAEQSADAAESPKKKGGARKGAGRPKGSRNKIKRKPDEGPSPIPRKTRARAPRATGPAGAAAAPTGKTAVAAVVDPDTAAHMVVEGLDQMVVTLASLRYADAAKMLSPDEDGKKALKQATSAYVASVDVDLTPGQMLLMTFGLVYAPRLGALEKMHRDATVDLVAPPATKKE